MLYREKREKDMDDERSYRTQRRLLVLGMCLGYLGCLLVLWYIWSAPRQWWFDTFWLHIGANRFTLILIPLIIFCVCYLKLRCISGNMLKFRDRQLDERQRMVRDSAHRTAYKIITLLCLLIPLYLAAQGIFARPPAPTPASPSAFTVIRPAMTGYVIVAPHINTQDQITQAWLALDGKNTLLHTITIWRPAVIWQLRPTPPTGPAPVIVQPNAGIYYGLVLLTLLLIISTLPKAIVAWQER